MYSGTTFNKRSGRIAGVHQRIDRVARRSIRPYLPTTSNFPGIQDILHFEGKNGPDGIKSKSPGIDEPWHYIDPNDPTASPLLTMIHDHIFNLAAALRIKNDERAAFEAAWMAHAITDGLTPAHHYPLEAKLEELRGGLGLETRTSAKEKIVIPGKNRRHQLRNNWEFWGAKGVMTTHLGFELGVASSIAGYRFGQLTLSDDQRAKAMRQFEDVFLESLRRVAALELYEEFGRLGWSRNLAKRTQQELMPEIITTVMLGWYTAIMKAAA